MFEGELIMDKKKLNLTEKFKQAFTKEQLTKKQRKTLIRKLVECARHEDPSFLAKIPWILEELKGENNE